MDPKFGEIIIHTPEISDAAYKRNGRRYREIRMIQKMMKQDNADVMWLTEQIKKLESQMEVR